jgi:uncharacterized protein with NRDE domain
MCLIALAWQAHPEFSLVLAANRDEFHARPAAPLAFDAGAATIGGRDLEAGGRWLGLTPSGRMAAVTNVRRGVAESPRPHSRGELVEGFLRSKETSERWLQALSARADGYARFNLLVSDGQTLGYAGNADGWHAARVDPGLHTLSNAALDTPWPKSLDLRAALAQVMETLRAVPEAASIEALLAALQSRRPAADADLPDTGLGRERERALSSAFVAVGPYGTRCSSIVLQRRDGGWWFIEQRYGHDGASLGRTLLCGDARGERDAGVAWANRNAS